MRTLLQPRPCRVGGVLIIGECPRPGSRSLETGHWYQQEPTKGLLWPRLQEVGLLPQRIDGWEDDALVEAGHGLIDLVKQLDPGQTKPTQRQRSAGAPDVRDFINDYRPGLLVFMYKRVGRAFYEVRAYMRKSGRIPVGYIPQITIEGVPIFVFTVASRNSAEEHRENNEDLGRALSDCRIWRAPA